MITTKLKIRTYGDPCLRKKSEPVTHVGPAERLLIASMIETMHHYKGIGLAAPQVGINEQILVADVGQGPIAIINPQIIQKAGAKIMEEGCLSIPGLQVDVKRPEQIRVKFLNEDNEVVERSFSDLLARVILHENDHLKGKLIVDYLPLAEQVKVKKKLKKLQDALLPKDK